VTFWNRILLNQQTLQTFLDNLAGAAPTPGGGGAAAFSGAMGAALVSMVCNLTLGRPKFANVEARIGEILARAEELRAELTNLVTEDARAVDSLMAAYRLPKDTDTEKAARQAAIQAGAKKAVLSPLATARACAETIALGQETAKLGNPNAASDAQAGAICAGAGLKIAVMNGLSNLKLIKDDDFVARSKADLEQILADYQNNYLLLPFS
jgi:formiminotetrahydrofolate cyclodeaminase